MQLLKSRLRRTEAQLQDVAKEAAPTADSKKETEELQRLRAQLEESLRNEERLRRQLEEVRPGTEAEQLLCSGVICWVQGTLTARLSLKGSATMQESSKQAPSVFPEKKTLDAPAPAADALTKPDPGSALPAAPPVLSDLLKAPEAATEPAPPSSLGAEAAASPAPAPPVATPSIPAADLGSPLSVLVSPAAHVWAHLVSMICAPVIEFKQMLYTHYKLIVYGTLYWIPWVLYG